MNSQQLTSRAFEIADEAMLLQLECHTLRVDEFGMTRAITDGDGNGVHDLANADSPIQEAIEWLAERKLAEVISSPDGLVVLLIGERP